MSLSDDIGKLTYDAREFITSVTEVTIFEGRIKDDPKYWEIKFNGLDTPIKIEAEDLDSSIAFKRKFLKLTNTPAPPLKASEWFIALKYWSEKATQGKYAEESDNVYVAERLFEEIRGLTKIERDHVLRAKGYVIHDGHRCVQHHTIKALMEGLGFKLNPRLVSDTLTQLGYKNPGSEKIWINALKKPVRFWWFKETAFKNEEMNKSGESV
jgi:hypothetical protein